MNNTQVGHSFVYGDNGKGSNFESSNGTLWSYGSVLAIKKGDWIIISNHISNYSSTSQRHASHLSRAIGYGTHQATYTATVYYGEPKDFYYKDSVKQNMLGELKSAIEFINEMLLKQSRARSAYYFDTIESRIENTIKLIELFGVDKRSSLFKEFKNLSDIENLKENYVDLIKEFGEREKKKAKALIEKRHARLVETLMQKTGMTASVIDTYTKTELATYDFIWIDGEQLCTTQSLCVNLREARILYKLLVAGKDIIGRKIGYYTIISHNSKSVKIGCHTILVKELERVLA